MKAWLESIVLGIILYVLGYTTVFYYRLATSFYLSALLSDLNSGLSLIGSGAIIIGIYFYMKEKSPGKAKREA